MEKQKARKVPFFTLFNYAVWIVGVMFGREKECK